MLGVRLAGSVKRLEGAPLSASLPITFAVCEAAEPGVLDRLRLVEPTFRERIIPTGSPMAGYYSSSNACDVVFLIGARNIDYYEGRLDRSPVGQTWQMSPRPVNFLTRQSTMAILLYGAGLLVSVPTPERYALHALLQAGLQMKTDKCARLEASENLMQACSLIEVLSQQGRSGELARIYKEIYKSGPYWKDALRRGLSRLNADDAPKVRMALAEGIRECTTDAFEFSASDMRQN